MQMFEKALGIAMCAALSAGSVASAGVLYSENFNSNAAPGWIFGGIYYGSQWEPSVSFANGTMRVQGQKAPFANYPPQEVNAGPFSVQVSDVSTSVDIVGWDDTARQLFGVIGRVDLDLNTGFINSAYQAYIVTRRQANANVSTLNLARLDPTAQVAIAPFIEIPAVDVTHDYRVTLDMIGTNVSATFRDLTTNTVLGTLSASGSASVPYTNAGLTGIMSAGNGVNYGIDATFDNFVVVPEPAAIASLAVLPLLLRRRRRGLECVAG